MLTTASCLVPYLRSYCDRSTFSTACHLAAPQSSFVHTSITAHQETHVNTTLSRRVYASISMHRTLAVPVLVTFCTTFAQSELRRRPQLQNIVILDVIQAVWGLPFHRSAWQQHGSDAERLHRYSEIRLSLDLRSKKHESIGVGHIQLTYPCG